MVTWGVWAVYSTVAMRTTQPGRASALTLGAATVVVGGYTLFWERGSTVGLEGARPAVLAGLALGAGMVAFYLGLTRGATGVVTSISALYFVVAAVLGFVFLGQPLSWVNVAGIGFAAVAITLLSL
jgi:uncharacterized membrane protein